VEVHAAQQLVDFNVLSVSPFPSAFLTVIDALPFKEPLPSTVVLHVNQLGNGITNPLQELLLLKRWMEPERLSTPHYRLRLALAPLATARVTTMPHEGLGPTVQRYQTFFAAFIPFLFILNIIFFFFRFSPLIFELLAPELQPSAPEPLWLFPLLLLSASARAAAHAL